MQLDARMTWSNLLGIPELLWFTAEKNLAITIIRKPERYELGYEPPSQAGWSDHHRSSGSFRICCELEERLILRLLGKANHTTQCCCHTATKKWRSRREFPNRPPLEGKKLDGKIACSSRPMLHFMLHFAYSSTRSSRPIVKPQHRMDGGDYFTVKVMTPRSWGCWDLISARVLARVVVGKLGIRSIRVPVLRSDWVIPICLFKMPVHI
ncbi:hypothetical protein EDB84DRAFT_1438600 [Lactarius hengduanensis]|nr:hypothetical protein EDB84DRAFT_1438600 [Lactarius hengduanensis]